MRGLRVQNSKDKALIQDESVGFKVMSIRCLVSEAVLDRQRFICDIYGLFQKAYTVEPRSTSAPLYAQLAL